MESNASVWSSLELRLPCCFLQLRQERQPRATGAQPHNDYPATRTLEIDRLATKAMRILEKQAPPTCVSVELNYPQPLPWLALGQANQTGLLGPAVKPIQPGAISAQSRCRLDEINSRRRRGRGLSRAFVANELIFGYSLLESLSVGSLAPGPDGAEICFDSDSGRKQMMIPLVEFYQLVVKAFRKAESGTRSAFSILEQPSTGNAFCSRVSFGSVSQTAVPMSHFVTKSRRAPWTRKPI